MSPRPVIFISAVSRELKTARQLVANTLTFLGYEPEWQDLFGAGEGDLRAMLRRRIDASAGVVQLIGQSYGAEPVTPDPDFGRVSYTQYEALYARACGKKVWPLLLDEHFTADPHEPEPEELRALQQAYRERVRTDIHLFQPIDDARSLELHLHKLRSDLTHLRRRSKMWLTGIAAMLVLIAALVGWQMHEVRQEKKEVVAVKDEFVAMKEELAGLRRGINQFAGVQAEVQHAQPGATSGQIEAGTYAALAQQLGIDEKKLRTELPALAEKLRHAPDSTTLERANAAYVAKDYAEAERLALAAAAEANQTAPPRHVDAITAWLLAGNSAREHIQYASAAEHLREAEKLTDRQRDPAEWARVQFALGRILDAQGQYHEALATFQQIVTVQTLALGARDPDLLLSRLWLGTALWRDGQAVLAERELREVITLEQAVRGPEHADTLKSRNNLANALHDQGKHAEAVEEHRTVLAIRERVLGPEHADTLRSRFNLASALAVQGEHAVAEREYRTVLAAFERLLGLEHPDTLRSRMGVASALDDLAKYTEAVQEYRAILAIQDRVLGPEHPDSLTTRMGLATALGHQDQQAEAEQEYRNVLATQDRMLNPKHPHTLRTRSKLASALQAQGKQAEAEQEYRAVFVLCEQVFGPDHRETLASRSNLANALEAEGKNAEAEQEHRAVLTSFEKILGPADPDVFQSCYNLALTLAKQKKYPEALGFAKRAEEGWQKILGSDHADSTDAKVLRLNIETKLHEDQAEGR